MPAMPRPTADQSALDNVTDLDAITDVVRGNREMFEVIVRRYNPQLFRVGMAYLRDHGLAEDAMQNAYLKAFLHLDRFQRDAAFSTWLTRIMINECLMILRRRKARPEVSLDAPPAARAPDHDSSQPINPSPPSPEPAAAEHVNLKEMKALLEPAIAALPRNLRAVYMLREVQQLSTAETAACLKISAASVKVNLHRARERLKSELLKSAGGAELFAYPAFFCDRMTNRVLRAILAVS
jgi:RNA polymerase sigma-70 factor, ECF subfamily